MVLIVQSRILRASCSKTGLTNSLLSISRRTLVQDSKRAAPFAFAFDIDGVLLRSSNPLPGATKALQTLQSENIPFILLTNGGGKLETERVRELSSRLEVPISEDIFIQSHTPYAALVKGPEKLENEPILVMGGEGDKCRKVAESYGFKNVIIPSDIFHAHPEIWPFSAPFAEYHAAAAKPLPLPMFVPTKTESEPVDGKHLRIQSTFVYNDPRDMGLETQLALDLILSHRGFLGTTSKMNGQTDLPNYGYQQDGQPKLYFANPDLFWAAQYHVSRLGSGGFQASLRGLFDAVTKAAVDETKYRESPILQAETGGKPSRRTYDFAELQLLKNYSKLQSPGSNFQIKNIYMVGDNLKSDIMGANGFQSPKGIKWSSLLVRSGVWKGEEPLNELERPTEIVDGVYDAVRLVLAREGWPSA